MNKTLEVTKLIETLKTEAGKDKTTSDVLHMFAVRGRARHRVTVDGLKQRMKREGFDHDNDSYRKVLKLLQTVGVGRLEVDAKGRIRALTDIRLTLQSIGKAALGTEAALKSFRKRASYSKLPTLPAAEVKKALKVTNEPYAPLPVIVASQEPARTIPSFSSVGLTVMIGEHRITIPLSGDLTSQEIAAIAERFQDPKQA